MHQTKPDYAVPVEAVTPMETARLEARTPAALVSRRIPGWEMFATASHLLRGCSAEVAVDEYVGDPVDGVDFCQTR